MKKEYDEKRVCGQDKYLFAYSFLYAFLGYLWHPGEGDSEQKVDLKGERACFGQQSMTMT